MVRSSRSHPHHGGAVMTTPEVVLHPAAIVAQLKKNNFTHVVWLPDSETNFMYQLLTSEPSLDLVPVCREGETMAIAAGPVGRRQKARGVDPEHRDLRVRRLHSRSGVGRQSPSGHAHRLPGLDPPRCYQGTRPPSTSSTSFTHGASTTS